MKSTTPLAEAPTCSVAVDRVARQLKLSRASVYRLLRRFRQHCLATALLPSPPGRKMGRVLLSEPPGFRRPALISSFFRASRLGLGRADAQLLGRSRGLTRRRSPTAIFA
jgi:Helix-turn-helix domain